MSILNKFMMGSPILSGDNTVPGLKLPEDLAKLVPTIIKSCHEFDLDFYPIVVQKLTYDEISEVASYHGFPVRYPHWKWGMEYAELQKGYEHGKHRIYEMVINCLGCDTPVLTTLGTIRAVDVRPGMQVVLGNDTRNVVAVVPQESSETHSIHMEGYLRKITCTPNHKWKMIGETGLRWVEASEVGPGDLLLGVDSYQGFLDRPSKLNWDRNVVISETRANVAPCMKSIVPMQEMTLPFAELLGVMVGDGSCGVKGEENSLSVAVGYDVEQEYVDHVAEMFELCFGIKPTVHNKPACRKVLLQSKEAVYFCSQNGMPRGCTYKIKRVPECIWKSSQEYRAAFIRGLFDADGYANDVVGFSCFNRDLAEDVQQLLLEMGIATKATCEENGHNKIYVVEVQGKQNLEKFQNRIDFNIQHKRDGLNRRVNTQYCRGGGIHIPYAQKLCVEWAKENNITTYNNPSLGYSIKRMEKGPVGVNCLHSFYERAVKSGLCPMPDDLVIILNSPVAVVGPSFVGPKLQTIDIALDGGCHDFVASGWVTHNTNPAYIYCLDSNTLVDDVTVIAHAIGHNDFFKNNVFFAPTSENMMNHLANHGTRIRRYIARWGKERVTEFIDDVLRIDTLIDPMKAWSRRKVKDVVVRDERKYVQPVRLPIKEDHEYMDSWVNPPGWKQDQDRRAKEEDVAQELEVYRDPTKDIMGYLKDHAPLKPWQQDIMAMLYNETMYFAPQRMTHMMNEGWASFVDFNIIAKQGLASLGQERHDMGIFDYAHHKMGVLGGKYSMNPYKLGFCLFMDIEERWNKGRFGPAYEQCQDIKQREDWDEKLGLGHNKVLEVRKYYDDITVLAEFFTPDFCNEYEFFEWKRYPNGEYKIENRDAERIKKKLIKRYLNGGLPEIRLADPNHKGKGILFLQHEWDGRLLYGPYAKPTLASLYRLWGNDVCLATKNKGGEEVVLHCYGPDEEFIEVMGRDRYEMELEGSE